MLRVLLSRRILNSQRLFQRCFSIEKAHLQKILKLQSQKILTQSNRSFQTSSALRDDNKDNKNKKESDEEKERKKMEEELRKRNVMYLFAAMFSALVGTLWIGTYDYFTNKRSSQNGDQEITSGLFGTVKWRQFVLEMLAKGEVEEVVVFPERNNVIVKLYEGAIVRGQDPVPYQRMYRMEIPNVAWFEENLRKAEQSLGIPPGKGVLVVYDRMNVSSYLFLYAIVGLAFYMLFKLGRGQSRFPGMFNFPNLLDGVRKAKFRIVDPSIPSEAIKIKFTDVVGLHEAKVEVQEFVDYLRVPENYTKLGAKLPKGALLLGPPGCGKTLLAKAISAEANVPFLATNGTEFVEMIGGLGAARVRDLFKEAKRRAPCIIYIDEVDAVGRHRGRSVGQMGRGNSEEEQTLNQLLVEMDGMESNKGVVVIASTNRADTLDKALLRAGRFDRHINIDLPTLIERKEIFEYYLKKIKIEKPANTYSTTLAQLTPGFSGADIANVCNEAAIRAATAERSMVVETDLSQALDRVLTGPEKRSTTISPEEKEIVAYHESGHALVGWLLKYTDALLKVTIIPRTVAALGFAQYHPQDKKLYSQEELFDRMCMMLGGRAAENIIFKSPTSGAQNDLERVTRSAYDQIKNYGMSTVIGPLSYAPIPNSADKLVRKPYSKNLSSLIDREVNSLVMRAYNATEQLLRDNKDKLDLLAKTLLKKETMSYDDVKQLLGPPKYGEKRVTQSVEFELPSPIDVDAPPPPPNRSANETGQKQNE